MYRGQKLVIRLTPAEQETIRRLAEAERLPASTLARAILLKEADAGQRETATRATQEASAHA